MGKYAIEVLDVNKKYKGFEFGKMGFKTRKAKIEDLSFITKIYNQGIEDRIVTLETRLRDIDDMKEWFLSRAERYKVVVIE